MLTCLFLFWLTIERNARMMRGIFITATDTDVGKTVVTGLLAKTLRTREAELDKPIGVWKPVQSGAPSAEDGSSDSARLQKLAGLDVEPQQLNGVNYALPLAPWMAARRVGQEVPYAQLLAETNRRLDEQFCLIEGAGGVHVPLTAEHTVLDLMQAVELPVLVVARPGHTVLTVEAIRGRGLQVIGVILNGVQPDMDEQAIQENREMIERFGNVTVLGQVPWLDEEQREAGHPVFDAIWGRILR
jgi:dethiobiotin synthetase